MKAAGRSTTASPSPRLPLAVHKLALSPASAALASVTLVVSHLSPHPRPHLAAQPPRPPREAYDLSCTSPPAQRCRLDCPSRNASRILSLPQKLRPANAVADAVQLLIGLAHVCSMPGSPCGVASGFPGVPAAVVKTWPAYRPQCSLTCSSVPVRAATTKRLSTLPSLHNYLQR